MRVYYVYQECFISRRYWLLAWGSEKMAWAFNICGWTFISRRRKMPVIQTLGLEVIELHSKSGGYPGTLETMTAAEQMKANPLMPYRALTDVKIRNDPRWRKWYAVLFDRYPEHPVFIDQHGTLRWKPNAAVVMARELGDLRLNDLMTAACKGAIPMEDLATVSRMMGTSLSAFLDIYGHRLSLFAAPEA